MQVAIMLWLYILSLLVGAGLGIVQAYVFYRGNKRIFYAQDGSVMMVLGQIGAFLVRYIGLFVFLWILLVKYQSYHFNIYAVMVGFFVAFWGVILKSVKGRHES